MGLNPEKCLVFLLCFLVPLSPSFSSYFGEWITSFKETWTHIKNHKFKKTIKSFNVKLNRNKSWKMSCVPLVFPSSSFSFFFFFFVGEWITSFIPLSHYSRNAPRIHNVSHFIQIAKVPSGVCKSHPAFVLDSATFVAIAKCSQTQLRVGNLFHFHQNSCVHWEPNTTNIGVLRIWYDDARTQDDTGANFCTNIWRHGWEWKECQTTLLRII